MSKKMHGRASIRIDGQYFDSDDDASFSPGGIQNTGGMVGSGFYYSQENTVAEVKMKIPVTKEIDLVSMQSLAEVEIIFESDNGITYMIRSAVQTGRLELQGGSGNGKVELTFQGEPAERME
ncbi:MAG: hypothetical protein DI551_08195 [Micavibrio aeruginosavorus]|uniref:Phage tail protein n=1 Tax=Micavibrio aeruginosavorus TaxID=349221 RepID=A0A2W5MXU2_9BACT|nr:MAG: hypothetical protein DI551_08195 [Micavibrio aeruginosavorus]